MVLERMVQKIRPGGWNALEELDKRYNALEAKYGFPPKRRYRMMLGGNTLDTLVVEREWESMADWEKAWMASGYMLDPEYIQLEKDTQAVIESVQWEAYLRLP